MRQTAMSQAFERAAMKSPSGRLKDMALDAIRRSNGNFMIAKGLLLESLMNDAPALNALMGETVHPRAAAYISELWKELHKEPEPEPKAGEVHEMPKRRKSSGGHSAREVQKTHAARNGGGRGHTDHEAHGRDAPAAATSTARREAAQEAWKLRANSLLWSFQINGKPLGDCTAGEVIEFTDSSDRKTRWLRAVVYGLQPEMRVAEYVDPEKVEELWEKSR